MFRPALRVASSAGLARAAPRPHILRRFASTAPPHQKSRSWKSAAARCGLAGALVYYYNTSSAFAEEPTYAVHAPPETAQENEEYATVASISEQRRAAQSRQELPAPRTEVKTTTATIPDGDAVVPGSPEALEEEASQEGAFNEETGEINWDCPCLGGMAHGPCGEQFRAAFSCFVFSNAEPKGVDCIEHFKTMQNCFREHPDVYGAELDDEDEDEEGIPPGREQGDAAAMPPEAGAPQAASVGSQSPPVTSSTAGPDASSPEPVPRSGQEVAQSTTQAPQSERIADNSSREAQNTS